MTKTIPRPPRHPNLPKFGKSARAFSPADLGTMTYWFDAQDLATLYQSQSTATPVTANGQDVRWWANKAVAANPVQIGAANKCTYSSTGINGFGAVANGGTGCLQCAGGLVAQGFTTYVVYKHSAVVNSSNLFDNVTGTTDRARYTLSAGGVRQMMGGSTLTGTTSEDTSVHVGAFIFNGADSFGYVDGAMTISGNVGAQGQNGLTLMSSRTPGSAVTNSLIGEFIQYPVVHTPQQMQKVIAYLNRKWGQTTPTFPKYTLSAGDAATRLTGGTDYLAWAAGAFSTYISFDHLPYAQGSAPTTAVRQVPYGGGNTTYGMERFMTDANMLEIYVRAEYKNSWHIWVDGVAYQAGALYPTVEDDGKTYRILLELGSSRPRLIEFGCRGQLCGVRLPAGATITKYTHPGTRTYAIWNSWGSTGAALDTADGFGNTQPGSGWTSVPANICRTLGLNQYQDWAGGAGWKALGTAGNNHLGRLTDNLAGFAAGTFKVFICSGPDGNDKDELTADVTTNMEAAYQLMRAHNATAEILFVGPGVYQDSYTSEWDTLTAAVIAWAATHASDPYLAVLDTRGWLAWAGGNAANIHTALSHPTFTGHRNFATYCTTLALPGYPRGFIRGRLEARNYA